MEWKELKDWEFKITLSWDEMDMIECALNKCGAEIETDQDFNDFMQSLPPEFTWADKIIDRKNFDDLCDEWNNMWNSTFPDEKQ